MAAYASKPQSRFLDSTCDVAVGCRGGWTWYTGSADWLYWLIVESLLRLGRAGDRLWLAPCLPAGWQTFTVHYWYRETV